MKTAGTTQATATAADTQGATSAATGASATSPTNEALDPFDAALAAELGEGAENGGDSQEGAQTDGSGGEGDGAGASSTAGDGQGNGEGEEAGTENGNDGDGSNGTTEDLPEEIDPDRPPKGLEDVPKAVWKRIQKQSETIRELKANAENGNVIAITPTPSSPLAHVVDGEGLKKEIVLAKNVRQLLGGLKESDYEEKDGVLQAEITVGNQRFVFSKEDVTARLAAADTVLDAEVLMERQTYIANREAEKPWEAAEKVLPGVLKKGTPENNAYLKMLKDCPEIASRLPDFEYVAACALRGKLQFEEEAKGKVKYVRMELDGKGGVIPPKAAAKPGSAPAKTTTSPNGQRPPVGGQGQKPGVKEVLAAKTGASAEERLEAALDAELGW